MIIYRSLIVLQIEAKLGGTPWALVIPEALINQKNYKF